MKATWYDGRTSRGLPVTVRLQRHADGPALRWEAEDGTVHELASHAIGWPERFAASTQAVTVDLRERGSLHVDDASRWFAAFDAAGGRQTVPQRMQARWTWLFAVAGAALAVIAAFHQWGTPWAAQEISKQVPLSWETRLTDRVLDDFDRQLLHPSTLGEGRRAALQRRFDAIVEASHTSMTPYAGYMPKWRLLFRSGLGPNALALPGGTIIVTDDLVQEADKLKLADDALAGVMAHEIGHVVYRHTTRLIIEQAVLNVAFGIATGDITTFIAVTGSTLAGLAYHRAYEAQADCFGAALMQRTGVTTAPLGELLIAVARDALGESRNSALASLLSTHPGSSERAQRLREGNFDACEGER